MENKIFGEEPTSDKEEEQTEGAVEQLEAAMSPALFAPVPTTNRPFRYGGDSPRTRRRHKQNQRKATEGSRTLTSYFMRQEPVTAGVSADEDFETVNVEDSLREEGSLTVQ